MKPDGSAGFSISIAAWAPFARFLNLTLDVSHIWREAVRCSGGLEPTPLTSPAGDQQAPYTRLRVFEPPGLCGRRASIGPPPLTCMNLQLSAWRIPESLSYDLPRGAVASPMKFGVAHFRPHQVRAPATFPPVPPTSRQFASLSPPCRVSTWSRPAMATWCGPAPGWPRPYSYRLWGNRRFSDKATRSHKLAPLYLRLGRNRAAYFSQCACRDAD